MTDEKWLDLKDTLNDKFEVTEEAEEEITKDDVGNEMINRIERLVFEMPLGEMRVERVTRPKILDKKVHYSHTAGTKGLVEYILSPDEVTQKVSVYKKDDHGEWQELSMGSENISF